MTMMPLSGKDGYLIYDSVEIPIYSWICSCTNQRNKYITVDSLNSPVRTTGSLISTIALRGVQFVPSFYSALDDPIIFHFGWNDFASGDRKNVPVYAMATQFILEYSYTVGRSPTFSWTANFVVCNDDTLFQTAALTVNDVMVCANSMCSNNITTSDTNLHSGFVWHVKKATLVRSFDREIRYTSSSNNHPSPVGSSQDTLVTLNIEGDFDYWMSQVQVFDDPYNYGFYYSPSLYWAVNSLKAESITDIVVNVETSEIISASVLLGVARG